MADPDSKFLSNPFHNWSGLSFEIQQRFEGTKLKYPGEKDKNGKEIFWIKFSWTRDMRFWCKYEGVFKVNKADVRKKDEFVFQIPQKDETIPDGYRTSPSNVSERFDNSERAAKEFDNALVAIGLKPLNFPHEECEDDKGPPALYFKIDDQGNLFLQARPKPGEKIDLNGLSMEEWDKLYKDACKSGVSKDKVEMLKPYLCGLLEEERKEFEKGATEVRWSDSVVMTEPYLIDAENRVRRA